MGSRPTKPSRNGHRAKAHDARPADLKRLDTKRLADPEWYKRGNMFGMTMYTDLFAGDLKVLN